MVYFAPNDNLHNNIPKGFAIRSIVQERLAQNGKDRMVKATIYKVATVQNTYFFLFFEPGLRPRFLGSSMSTG